MRLSKGTPGPAEKLVRVVVIIETLDAPKGDGTVNAAVQAFENLWSFK